MRRSSSCSRSESAMSLRERLLLRDRDPLGRDLERPRVDAARAVAELAADLATQMHAKVARRRAPRARRSSRCRRRPSRSSARGPTPGRSRIGNGARNAASRPGRTTVSPPGLRRSEATFATTFDVATPSEHESRVRARTTACTASASARASSNDGRDLAEVEVALVDPRLLDRRDDLADRRPDLARVVLVERVPRADEHGLRTAAERLGARHRRVDPEPARDVVRGRDDAPAVRIAADDRAAPSAAPAPPAPRRRRRTRRGRDARRSCEQGYGGDRSRAASAIIAARGSPRLGRSSCSCSRWGRPRGGSPT